MTIDSKNGRDAIQEVNAAWGLEVPFFYWDDTFYWGKRPEQEYLYELNDSNILELEKSGGSWTAEVIGVRRDPSLPVYQHRPRKPHCSRRS
ncbi:MAG: hypothetical protein ACLS61_07560 [Ruminococcus sp.]